MATSRTTQLLRIGCDCTAPAVKSAALGGMLCCAEGIDTVSTGPASLESPATTARHAEFCIPIRRSASLRHDLRQEPYAVTLHVRICAGGGQQWPSLPRPFNTVRPRVWSTRPGEKPLRCGIPLAQHRIDNAQLRKH